jgi:hypothetical protein
MLKLVLAVLAVTLLHISCSHEITYKDEICYDKCLSQGLYVLVDTQDQCVCGKGIE